VHRAVRAPRDDSQVADGGWHGNHHARLATAVRSGPDYHHLFHGVVAAPAALGTSRPQRSQLFFAILPGDRAVYRFGQIHSGVHKGIYEEVGQRCVRGNGDGPDAHGGNSAGVHPVRRERP